MTLEDAARRAIAGDKDALNELVAALQGDLFGLALRMLANRQDAEDATQDGDSLLAASTRNSMRESLAALAMISEPRAQPQIVRSGETSLEGMARDLLRPALAEWLDKHLPPLVEQMVAAEISRIVGKRG